MPKYMLNLDHWPDVPGCNIASVAVDVERHHQAALERLCSAQDGVCRLLARYAVHGSEDETFAETNRRRLAMVTEMEQHPLYVEVSE